ncbi:MAG: hypothetical protein ABIN58_06665, partial [candidate division WOR-3 bacterium]
LTGILPAGPERIQMFVSRHYMQETWHVERLLLRTDGFVSIAGQWAGGEKALSKIDFLPIGGDSAVGTGFRGWATLLTRSSYSCIIKASRLSHADR